jgi:riboflavin biosynthesis pyrimidine reductase
MTKRRNVIVHIGISADGYIARPDGDLEWLTSRVSRLQTACPEVTSPAVKSLCQN